MRPQGNGEGPRRLFDGQLALDELSVLMLDLDEAVERQCLRCDVHFRRGCVLSEIMGVECELRTALFETARHSDE